MCAVVLSPGIAMSEPAGADQATWAVRTETAAPIEPRSLAVEILHGFVADIDQHGDSISIRLSPGTTERFRVQDGLLFDAVRFGDLVEVSVQSIDGVRTIVGLE